MLLTTRNAGQLVGGTNGPRDDMATQPQQRKLRVNRPFILDGKRREVGDEVTVPLALASELMTANKAEPAENEPSAAHLAAKAEAKARATPSKAAAPAVA